MTGLLAGFLAVHGLLHLAVWLPKPASGEDAPPPPFEPDHSGVLTAVHVSAPTTHRLAIGLAVAACVAYLLASVAVAADGSWAVGALVVAAGVGMALKGLYFHPWLSLGLVLDVLVLTTALADWPVTLS